MRGTRLNVILGSIAGAAIIHFVLAACNNSNANADSSCSVWEMQIIDITGGIDTAPEGWEPIGGTGQVYIVRHCKQ